MAFPIHTVCTAEEFRHACTNHYNFSALMSLRSHPGHNVVALVVILTQVQTHAITYTGVSGLHCWSIPMHAAIYITQVLRLVEL